ncbi:MAG: response regulator [Chloroflexi bacterium]|nr:response regulator [Chloroflexota bacterium]
MTKDEKLIIVVEDEADTAEMLAEMLKLNGYKVIKILNSAQAIEEIIDKKPDAILLDLMMPEVSGLDILEGMKKYPALDNIPTVVISAKGLPGNIESGFKAGASEYLVKPVTFQLLKKTLEKHLATSSNV